MEITKAEIDTIQARVLIITQYFPEFKGNLDLAFQYAQSDPSSSLLKSRQVLEAIFSSIWSKMNSSPPPSLNETINDGKIKAGLSSRILNKVHGLRTLTNLGVHGHQVNSEDAYSSLNHLFQILNWYGQAHKNLNELPIPVPPAHSFKQYLSESFKDRFFWIVLLVNILFLVGIVRYHRLFLDGANLSLERVYEGVFTSGIGAFSGLAVTIIYSVLLVFIVSLLSWLIFKRFRNQDFSSRLLSFELMFALVFSLQFFILNILDKFTHLF